MLLFQQHMFAVILLCALCALCGFCLFLRYLPSPNLAYELHNLKCGDMRKTFLYETVMVNRLQLMCPMADAEKTEIGDGGVLLQTGRQVAASSAGFTLIELIMVIVLIGIVAVSVLPKFVDTSSFSLEGATAMVVADIRYTQELAMGNGDDKKAAFTQNSTTYTLKNSDDTVFKTSELPSGVTVSSSNITFTFNSLGEPTTGGGSSVTLSAGGDTRTVTVESYTGRVSSS